MPILIQQPTPGVELNLIGLGDGEGGLCGTVAIKKLMTTSIGKIWTGVTIEHPELKRLAERFVAATKWKGPFELECIQDGAQISMIEINPRFPAWVYFATAVGINLPARLLDLIEGRDCDRSMDYPVGKYFVRYTYEMVTDMEKFFKLASSN
jgi:carbamoyl-phosphate synthase large subunit